MDVVETLELALNGVSDHDKGLTHSTIAELSFTVLLPRAYQIPDVAVESHQ